MSKYYIKFGLSDKCNAGSKAMKDIMYLLRQQGYRPVPSLPVTAWKPLKALDVPLLCLTLLFGAGRRGTLLYFVPSNQARISLLSLLSRAIGFRLVCFINDIESMRTDTSPRRRRQETGGIACADVLLAPNSRSVEILRRDYGIRKPAIPIGVWDYLHDSSPALRAMPATDAVAFAGNLAKAAFVSRLGVLDLTFRIWGDGRPVPASANLRPMGTRKPEEMVDEVAACAWGLVWDGDSIEGCHGPTGTYLRFNNPHKCGLYLAAGIPLIVWEESAMSPFVRRHGVGICVSSLHEAAGRIRRTDEATYRAYRQNARLAGEQIRKGGFFLEALKQLDDPEKTWNGKRT